MLIVAGIKDSKCRMLSESEKSLTGLEKLSVPRSEIPAVTHVDYSARVQTVHEDTNERYYRLLKSFEQKTGVSRSHKHQLQCARRTYCLYTK